MWLRVAVAWCVLLVPGLASAATPVSCGKTIDVAGRYYLRASCTCTGNGPCISITASDVTLDLNNKVLTCNPGDPVRRDNDTTFGVRATSLRNITIMGCDSTQPCSGKITGCYFGLEASHDANLLVDRVDFSGNTYVAADISYSTRTRVTHNLINGIAGYLGVASHNGYAIGFYGCGAGCSISDNIIKGVVTQRQAIPPLSGEGAGVVYSANAVGGIVSHNWFENDDETSANIGVRVGEHGAAIIQENTFAGFWHAISGPGTVSAYNNRMFLRKPSLHPDSIGIYGGAGDATNNLIVNYNTAVHANVRDAGGNIVFAAPKTESLKTPEPR